MLKYNKEGDDLDISHYEVSAVKVHQRESDPEYITKINIDCRPSKELTQYNSNFNGDYKKARKFERDLLEKLKNK